MNYSSDDWLTPPEIIKALGRFDLDPCSPIMRPWDTANRHFTFKDDGILQPWRGRVWLNPPYSQILPWMTRMAQHRLGTALVNARTQAQWFFDCIWEAAEAVLFVKAKIRFYRPNGERGEQGWSAHVFAAYSQDDAWRLSQSGIKGKFIPLVFKFAAEIHSTWRSLVRFLVRERGGVVRVDELYQMVATHPKARKNPHWKDKVRQTLQRECKRIGPALWERRTGTAMVN